MRRKIVLATGAFDLLHYGHLKFLEESKKAGDKDARLIVIVARDKTVKDRKGSRPVLPEDQRRALVEALKPVEKAILGYEEFNMRTDMLSLERILYLIGELYNDIPQYQNVLRERIGHYVQKQRHWVAGIVDDTWNGRIEKTS